ncbi:MAG: mucoidy inhibitor MuiA family protein [Polyangiaceae bacterium]|nr:mucoidy inhibitor MuiA family protein [Polyangiaceae bacterium]
MTDPSPLPLATVLSSKINRVTFFEDRAEVTRQLRCRVVPGSCVAQITGVTMVIDDSSLVAVVRSGGARVAASSVRRAEAQAGSRRAEPPAHEAEYQAARRRLFDAHRSLDRAEAEQGRLHKLLADWERSAAQAARPRADQLAALRAAYDEINGATEANFLRLERCRAELERAIEVERLATVRRGTAQAMAPRHEASVEIQLTSTEPGEVEIEVTYRTPCALWRPEHHAQLTPAAPQSPARLLLRTFAIAWQNTGEDWSNVPCRFSTARPSQTATAPLLRDDTLALQRRSDPRSIIIEERDQAMQLATLGRGFRRIEEMPGLDDGGEPLTLDARGPATIPSDGVPVAIELGEQVLPCESDLVSFPERSEAAHLRVSATWIGPLPLLAGPVRVAVGPSLLGVASTRYVAPGDPFELGFGHDDDVRVRRTCEERREIVPVIGTQKIHRKIRLYLSNLGRYPKVMRLVERVPVSEVRDLTVEITEAGGARLDPRSGFARFDLNLAPGQHLELAFAYRIEASSRVEM